MRNFILAGSLCFMVAVESTAIKYVKVNQGKDIPAEQLILLVEFFKLSISFLFYKIESRTRKSRLHVAPVVDENSALLHVDDDENGSSRIRRGLDLPRTRTHDNLSADEISDIVEHEIEEQKEKSGILWYFVPAGLYAISNNVTFMALALMTPAMFNLLMNLKIPLTAIMAWLFIGYKINTKLAISFLTLFIGSAIATLRIQDGKINIEGSAYGVLLMFVYASCSAAAAVYIEYLMKMRFGKESMHVQNMKFCICSAIANVIVIIVRGKLPYITIEPLHLISVCALGFNGLVTSAVLKYGGSILKTYAVSVAMFLSALFTWIFFHMTLSWNFYFGAGICAVSVNLYAWEKMRKH